jgi:hypothetical protein
MRLLPLVAVLSFIASQTVALSCVRPDPVRAFQTASAATESYIVIYGSFDFDVTLLPPDVQDESGQDAIAAAIPSEFTGNGLSPSGFEQAMIRKITIQPICFGPWCGQMPANAPVLAFAKQTEAGYVVEADPCGGWVFANPSQDVLDQMTACLRGEDCETADGQ